MDCYILSAYKRDLDNREKSKRRNKGNRSFKNQNNMKVNI